MPSLQTFLAEQMPKMAANLLEALDRVPADKRNWSPGGTARSAMDMVAECAILGDMADMVRTRKFPENFSFEEYETQKGALVHNEELLRKMLHAGVQKTIDALADAPDEDLAVEIPMPWGPITLAQLIAYPYYNMSYHEGQINYIASILGTLD